MKSTPTVHLNGTGRYALVAQAREVYFALGNVLEKMLAAFPNGRDYYLQSDGALQQAMEEHRAMQQKVIAMRHEWVDLAIRIEAQKQ